MHELYFLNFKINFFKTVIALKIVYVQKLVFKNWFLIQITKFVHEVARILK